MNEQEVEIKLKKNAIDEITKELKSHYLLEEFFVDPDKKFINLLEKIIKFFEEDDFIIHIRQNEHLYENFKTKYESAVELIKSIDLEKEKLQNRLSNLKKTNEYYCYYNYRYYDGDSPNKYTEFHEGFNNDSPKMKRPIRRQSSVTSNITSDFLSKTNLQNEHNLLIYPQTSNPHPNNISNVELEKLKEDYFNLYEEKKVLELQLLEIIPYECKYKEMNEQFTNLQIQFDTINSKSILYYEERNSLQERLNKLSKENFELVQNINTLKENLNNSEKERNGAKTKITSANNKIKMLDKEVLSLRKKNQSLNFQIKDLKEKLKDEMDEKILMEKKVEDMIQEFENKLAIKEEEKQKILKDSLTHLMNAINDEKCFEFTYNNLNEKIEIYFENAKIAEVDNIERRYEKSHQYHKHKNSEDNFNQNSQIENSSDNIQSQNIQLNTENSILYMKTDHTEVISPSKWKTNRKKLFEIYSENESNSRELNKVPSVGISLQKLFSKSKSSQKFNGDKENVSLFANGTEGSQNRENKENFKNNNHGKSNNILLLNLSSSKKQRTEYSKLDRGFSTINKFTLNQNLHVNPFSTIDNCIRKTNLNNNLRYVFSSNHRHKKVISLDQALGDLHTENEDVISNDHDKNMSTNLNLKKKLNFFTISNPSSFDIQSYSARDKKVSLEENEEEIQNMDEKNINPQFLINSENKFEIIPRKNNLKPHLMIAIPDGNNVSFKWKNCKTPKHRNNHSLGYLDFLFFKDYLM